MDAVAHTDTHAHPTPGLYLRIGITLFILTALEVALYEVARRHEPAGLAAVVGPVVVELLLLLSAIKFALVAMFYMHLKQDSKLFTGVFVFPLMIAAVVIMALIILFAYIHIQHPAGT